MSQSSVGPIAIAFAPPTSTVPHGLIAVGQLESEARPIPVESSPPSDIADAYSAFAILVPPDPLRWSELADLATAVRRARKTLVIIEERPLGERPPRQLAPRVKLENGRNAEAVAKLVRQLVRESAGSGSTRLRVGELQLPTDWRATPRLSRRLALAKAIDEDLPESPYLTVTFTQLCRSFFVGTEWQQLTSESGLTVPEALASELRLSEIASITTPAEWDQVLGEPISASTGEMLSLARRHADAFDSLLDEHHLIAAILFGEHGHRDDLERWQVDRVSWGGAFVELASAAFPGESEYWHGVRDRAFPAGPPLREGTTVTAQASFRAGAGAQFAATVMPALQTYSDRVHFTSDLVAGRISPADDQLGASAPARRIAKLFVAADVPPPIAVGLFGNWGSGKSFFMGLIKTHLDELTRDTAGGVYVKRAVPIDFNAWHYQDTNLWAGLAMRIFEVLSAELALDDATKSPEAIRQQLHRQLESSKAAKEEATSRQQAAITARTDAERNLEAARAKVRLIPNAPAGVGDYATWAPLVVRFSYHGLASPDLSAHSRPAAVAPSEAAG
jgi:hypothetical protein